MADPDQACDEALLAGLPATWRLALAYAPRAMRRPWLAFLALDQRLAGLLRGSREPMLAQLRFAWWRETLAQDGASWPAGEPLLVLLRSWQGDHGALVALVDGWERLTGPKPLPSEDLAAMASGRAAAIAAMAQLAGSDPEASETLRPHAERWALADLAAHLGDPREREAALALLAQVPSRHARLPRAMRPLAVLERSAIAALRREPGTRAGLGDLLAAMRSGLLGW